MRTILSIVTIVREDPVGLESTIIALQGQTYQDFEHVVINGGMDAATREVCDKYRARNRIVLSERDKGISDAFNKAAALISGSVVLYLNAGDLLAHAETLTHAVAAISKIKDPQGVVFYGDYIYCGNCMKQRVVTSVSGLTRGNSLNHQSMFIGADIVRAFPYDTRLKITMDYDVWLRCRNAGVEFVRLDMVVARFYEGGVSSSVEWLPYNLMSKEACKLFNNVYKRYRWRDSALFFLKMSLTILKGRLKVLLGPKILAAFRQVKFRAQID